MSLSSDGPAEEEFQVRAYLPQDFDALFALDQQCFFPEIAYSREELRYFLEAKDAVVRVAASPSQHLGDERAPKLIGGFLIAQVYRGRPTFQARIITLDVASALRRRRIAWALMQSCEEELRRQQVQRVRLEVAVGNLPAQNFYRRWGYEQISTLPRYYPTGEDALAMQKSL